jgi:hypothetical protein
MTSAPEMVDWAKAAGQEESMVQGGQEQNQHDVVISPLPTHMLEEKRPRSSDSTVTNAGRRSDGELSRQHHHHRHHRSSSGRSSPAHPHFDPEPGFVSIDGDVGGPVEHKETTVDIICVPCPGADPEETWSRESLPDGYFQFPVDNTWPPRPTLNKLAGETILSPGIDKNLPKAPHVWVRHGIRRSISAARVMLYRHRALTDGMTLSSLAQDLLHHVQLHRENLVSIKAMLFPRVS